MGCGIKMNVGPAGIVAAKGQLLPNVVVLITVFRMKHSNV
jgi:hypothetical protein